MMEKDAGCAIQVCPVDHEDALQLICTHQGDGTWYRYCQICGWVDVEWTAWEHVADELGVSVEALRRLGKYMRGEEVACVGIYTARDEYEPSIIVGMHAKEEAHGD